MKIFNKLERERIKEVTIEEKAIIANFQSVIDFSITFYVKMKEKILENIKNYNLIEKGDSIVIGFSGGIDSSALLHLLNGIKKELDFTIVAAHFNHGVRGKEGNRDEEFCRARAKELNIPFFSDKYNMDEYALEHKLSKEAAGRELRKSFFKKIMYETNSNKLALAHNMNDQVETLLFRIFRGTGLDGLKGMGYRDDHIIRPLLNIKRQDLEKYIENNKIDYVEDSTNSENKYQRNKIRNLLIPEIEKHFNPKLNNGIFNLSEIAKIDLEFLDMETERLFKKLVQVEDKKVKINIVDLNNLHKSMQQRIIRRIFYELLGKLEDLSLANINEVLDLADLESGKHIDNINKLKIRNSYGKLIFDLNNFEDKIINIDLKMGINKFQDKLIILEETDIKVDDKNIITIPEEFINNKLILRNRVDGDRIRQIGLNGSKKLKDIFIDKKIDRELRDNFLLICDDSNIFWVIDLVKSELVTYSSDDDRYIKVTIKNLEEKNA